ncbi:anti-sigma factor [Aliterella atlantica]|uniref:Regulator of SigK n=1 Tax=Aliterella atlantica CENA595 TaxID=1618023 RepID=A0A0D8ZT54_9CYAN|nr:anti-sigma factor [Aliterella atlantica]KJH71943.1 hypothetical protein UH38_09475 [Aliterella atlantica CENA595]
MYESSTPKNIEDLTVGYVLGNLCPHEAEEFIQLLAENPQLNREVERWQEVLALLPYGYTQTPPARVHDAILNAIEKPIGITRTPKQLVLPWNKTIAGTAAVLALALGVDNYYLRQSYSQAKEVVAILQGAENHVFALKGKEQSMAVGSVFMDFEANKAAIALQDLPPPPVGKAYWLWAVVEGKTIRCGQFNVSSSGASLDKIAIPAGAYQEEAEISQLFVTVESSVAPTSPSQEVVMVKVS